METGYCVKNNGQDQNSGVIKVNNKNAKSLQLKTECLKQCLAHPRSTGCEVIWYQSNKGCYIHTSDIARGNNAPRHNCWIFKSKGLLSAFSFLLFFLTILFIVLAILLLKMSVCK